MKAEKLKKDKIKPTDTITYSDKVLPPEEEKRLIAKALVVLFQLDTKLDASQKPKDF